MQLSLWRWVVTYFGWVVAITALVVMMQERLFREAYKYEAQEAQAISRSCSEQVRRVTESFSKCNDMVDQCIGHMRAEEIFRFEYRAKIAAKAILE